MAIQKFRFADLYRNNKAAVESTLSAMWCGEIKNESQRAYVKQLKEIIDNIFAPKNAVPLVQCMNSYKSVHSVSNEKAESLVGNLWKKSLPQDEYHAPYEHQYQCWNTLMHGHDEDGEYKSIVVTTGTGSGKTECFMMPLVQDLLDNPAEGQVQAIFLYPLNALMEDQKARLEKLLKDTDLRYAVYNSDLQERMVGEDHPDYIKILRKIDDIKGIKRDDDGNIFEVKYPHAIATREELRHNPANILLTNPTMLEYILLRGKDSRLINPELKSLRWIAIDETHTYTGAGAAEIAMLLRRVLMAYNVLPSEIRFATSSATIGKNDEEGVMELRRFIAGITGLELRQVVAIDGERRGIDTIPHDDDEQYWLRLIKENKEGYLPLDELFQDGKSIEEQLDHLDRMCQKAEEEGLGDLRVKVHYFYRVPNQGLYADLTIHEDGSFKIYTENHPDAGHNGKAPLIELSRCKHCGEYVAVAEANFAESTYQPITMDDSDMFDLDDTDDAAKKYLIFGMSDEPVIPGDNNAPYMLDGNKFYEGCEPGQWHVVGNTQCSCPYCGSKLTKRSKMDEDNPDVIQNDEQDTKKLQKFRVAADFVSRLIAPSTLELMTEGKPKDNSKIALHDGRQYLSFVDSRQMAARATIKQNLEEERLWVYSTIYHELCRLSSVGMTKDEAIAKQMKIVQAQSNPQDMQREMIIMMNLQSPDPIVVEKQIKEMMGTVHLTWQDIYDLLRRDELLDSFCQQFAERSEFSKELDEHGNITEATRRKYIHSILVQYLSKRPLSAAAPETMGLFTSHYPKLDAVLTDELPDAVSVFNDLLSDDLRISQKDWRALMQIFLDFTVRSNESLYLKMSDTDPMDIFKCVRFATQKDRRRPIRKPEIREKSPNLSRVIRLLAQLLSEEKHIKISDAIKGYQEQIQAVIDTMWDALIEQYKLISCGTHYDDDPDVLMHVKDKDEVDDDVHYIPYRLNLADLSFKLYDDVYLCDTNVSKDTESRHVACMRPIGTLFKGYSPYLIGGVPQQPKQEGKWETYPHYTHHKGERQVVEKIRDWAKESRALLWENDLWGNDGVFSDRLESIHQFPKLFIQAEHTAQVDKMISRQVQQDFKDHAINILACSTTMEMGVDLGDLELVMMTSVPPHPSNYKQRAGRSGRRGQVRSASVTLCGSDAIGMRTLQNPMASVILRPVSTPTVDLNSAQVIQRHINSFLVREFGVFNMGDRAGSIMQKVIDYYTPFYLFEMEKGSRMYIIKRKVGNDPVGPKEGLGDQTGTPYEIFNERCSEPLTDELREKLNHLLEGTIFEDRADFVVAQARSNNERCYAELERRISDLKLAYEGAKSTRQQNFFMLKYIEPLATQLLTYWATHRFTPNANMPVNVIEFDINSLKQQQYSATTPSNPSYPLRTALAQYAPGNPIARDGMVRIVRGIRYTDFFKPAVTFKKLYRNTEQVIIDYKDEIDDLQKWPVSGSTDLELLQPTEFVPDMNESANRILDQNIYTRVNAQLIGAEEWCPDRTEPHLFDARSNRESGDSKILYYNEGTGFGYCHCTKCGRTVLEQFAAASASDPNKLPSEMNQIKPSDSEKPYFHFSLVKKNNRPNRCMGCNSPEYIHRNVVLGDTIQTDYTEIRIRHLNEDWISVRHTNIELLTTLGILFAQSLADELNVERGDVDFTVTQNGHICVFDTNPGGSGYANKLAEMDLLKKVIRKSLETIRVAEEANSKDALVDRYTIHYIDNINIALAKAWIEEELSAQTVLPNEIKAVFPDATETSLLKLERAFAASQKESALFFDDNYNMWNYDGSYHGWKGHLFNYFVSRGLQTTIGIYSNGGEALSEPIKDMLRSIKGWTKNVLSLTAPFVSRGIYPLAYIDGYLYFTNNPEHTTLNDRWAGGTMYYAKTKNIISGGKNIDLSVEPNTTCIFWLDDFASKKTSTATLGRLLRSRAGHLIDDFIAHCKNNPTERVRIEYQDEHLKSNLGFLICLQTIRYYINEIGNEYSLQFRIEKYDSLNGKLDSLTDNMPSSYYRDMALQEYCNQWQEAVEQEDGIKGYVAPVQSSARRSLTHWRELSFECAGKKLSIYPDGGLANGWLYDKFSNPEQYDTTNVEYNTDIHIFRTQNLKFDVNVENIP